jgi:hypoxanthine phosphoribosyltransferase
LNGATKPAVLFSESEIRARVAAMAGAIAQLPDPPDLAVPILVGGFVFAADLLRGLDQNGLCLPVEFLRLRSYANNRTGAGEMAVLMVPESTAGRHVLLIDGVLDHGRTLKRAQEILVGTGARAVTTAVVIDKMRHNGFLRADFAAFTHVPQFVVGYGMDDAGRFRSLPFIGTVE